MLELNKIYLWDCLDVLKTLPDNSVDSIVTDPPYELGFMWKSRDSTGIANNVDLWRECLRVLKPWWHLLSFSGTRTYHRMASAVEDAGFEVRDMIEWVYGSGFPKSLNIGKAVDKLQGNEREVIGELKLTGTARNTKTIGAKTSAALTSDYEINNTKTDITKGTSEWEGWGTALKPAHEPICMARKPLSEKTVAENCLKWGTGGINIDESRVETSDDLSLRYKSSFQEGNSQFVSETATGSGKRMELEVPDGSKLGRFPANLIHDNSEEVRECFPDSKAGNYKGEGSKSGGIWSESTGKPAGMEYCDSGNASRFFKSILYYPQASKSERNKGCEDLEKKPKVFNGQSDTPSQDMKDVEKRFTTQPKQNNHPTVKPIALMEYLIKMVTPKGGVVLDPFAWSWTTLVAAKKNWYQYIGCELTEEYIPIIEARLNATDYEE